MPVMPCPLTHMLNFDQLCFADRNNWYPNYNDK